MSTLGFSFGGFVDGIELIRQLTNALKSDAGSSKEYQDLINELYSLERALLEVKQLPVDDNLRLQRTAVEQAALQCQETISQFLLKISKYQLSFRAGGSGSAWRDNLRKIQWALYQKEDVQRFRAQIQGHTSSIMTLLLALQLNLTNANGPKLNTSGSSLSDAQNDQLQLVQKSMCDNTAFLQALAGLLPTLQRITSREDEPTSDEDKTELRKVMTEVRQSNLEIYRMILAMQTSIPTKVEDQKPVYFLDACDCPARIDLTWINSWDAFFAVLGVRFKERGLKVVETKRFTLHDAHNNKIDSSRPFEGCFMPGRKINMDACFDEKEDIGNCCPNCRHQEPGIAADRPTDCQNCGTHYQRIKEVFQTEVEESLTQTQQTGIRGKLKREGGTDNERATDGAESDDEMCQFRRIRLHSRTKVKQDKAKLERRTRKDDLMRRVNSQLMNGEPVRKQKPKVTTKSVNVPRPQPEDEGEDDSKDEVDRRLGRQKEQEPNAMERQRKTVQPELRAAQAEWHAVQRAWLNWQDKGRAGLARQAGRDPTRGARAEYSKAYPIAGGTARVITATQLDGSTQKRPATGRRRGRPLEASQRRRESETVVLTAAAREGVVTVSTTGATASAAPGVRIRANSCYTINLQGEHQRITLHPAPDGNFNFIYHGGRRETPYHSMRASTSTSTNLSHLSSRRETPHHCEALPQPQGYTFS